MNQKSPQFDLDWLAFQYVTESLSAEERDDFERLLVEEQAAREAVARAVELTFAAEFACRYENRQGQGSAQRISPSHAVLVQDSSAEHARTTSTRRGSRGLRRAAWSSLAACAAFFLGWQLAAIWMPREPADVSQDLATTSTEGGDREAQFDGLDQGLALAWSRTRSQLAVSDNNVEGEEFSLDAGLDLAGITNLDDDGETSPLESVEAPMWMLAAVAGMQNQAESDQPGEGAGSPLNESGGHPVPQDNRSEG